MGVRRGCPKFFLKYPAVGADSHSRAADRYFRPPIVRRCASRRRPFPPWGRRREALPPGPEPLGMNPQLRGHFRGRLAAAEPRLHGMLLKGLVKLLSDVLGLVHRCIHSCFVHICLALPVSDFSRRPKPFKPRRRSTSGSINKPLPFFLPASFNRLAIPKAISLSCPEARCPQCRNSWEQFPTTTLDLSMNVPLPVRAKLIAAAVSLCVGYAACLHHDIAGRGAEEISLEAGCLIFGVYLLLLDSDIRDYRLRLRTKHCAALCQGPPMKP